MRAFAEVIASRDLEPVASPITDVASIAIKSSSSCALQRSGKVVCWGANHNAQLGLGTLNPGNELVAPTPVPKLDGITEIRLGGEMGVALQKGGRVLWWGTDEVGVSDEPTMEEMRSRLHAATAMELPQPSVAAEVGIAFGCALIAGGEIWCQGKGNLGQANTGESSKPLRVPNWQAVALSISSQRACALASDGTTWCWGSNVNKALGLPSGFGSPSPTRLGQAYAWASLPSP